MKFTLSHSPQYISVFLSVSCIVLALPIKSYAYTATNSDYSIELNDINTDNPEPTKKLLPLPIQPVNLPKTTNQINGSNYTISSTSDAYSFALSQTNVDFGALSATNPVIRTSRLSLASPLQGAEVVAEENRPMTATDRQFVPDTTCDNGYCTSGLPAPWESALTYGFGYRCDSTTKGICDDGFTNPKTYKQFPDASASESFNQIMLSQQSKQASQATITYKINISGTQPLGGYRNTITYIAVPNF